MDLNDRLRDATNLPHLMTEPPNTYRFTDASVWRPWVTRVWFERLFPLLPRWLAANLITLLSTGALLLVFGLALAPEGVPPSVFAFVLLLVIQFYVAGDHLDGMQAKATGTTSPLGDFLDHHCDLWAGCILVFAYCALTGTVASWQLPVMTLLMGAGFAVTYTERAEFRRLHFTSWGTLEAIVIVSVFFASWMVPPLARWWGRPLWDGSVLARHLVVTVLGCVMCVGAMAVIIRRMRGISWRLGLHLLTTGAVASWCQVHALDAWIGWLMTVLISAEFVARLMQAHTRDGHRPRPAWGAAVGAGALWLAPPSTWLPKLVLAWLVLVYLQTMWRVLWPWRSHWRWVNTAPSGR